MSDLDEDELPTIDITRENMGYAPLDVAPNLVPTPAMPEPLTAKECVLPLPSPSGQPKPPTGRPFQVPTPPVPRTHVRPIRFVSLEEIRAMPQPKWVIRRVVRRGELMVVFAIAGAGKTFTVIDIGMHIAFGMDWRGRRTSKGAVLYLSGEASTGIIKRIDAWLIEHGLLNTDLPFSIQVLPYAVDLMDQEQFDVMCEALKKLDPMPVLLIIDTLARYMQSGDENSTMEMGQFVARCSRIAEITGAAVLLVHHKGKGSASERGSSALGGAADVMLELTKDEEGVIQLVGKKSKDDAPLPPQFFTTKRIFVGVDDEGEDVYSLVLVPMDPPAVETFDVLGEIAPAPVEDSSAKLRSVLRTLFNGEASGSELCKASPVEKSRHYEVLKAEVEAGRIRVSGEGRKRRYLLVDPESQSSPVVSPVSPPDSRADSASPVSPSSPVVVSPCKGDQPDRTERTDSPETVLPLHQEQEAQPEHAVTPPPAPPGTLIDNREPWS